MKRKLQAYFDANPAQYSFWLAWLGGAVTGLVIALVIVEAYVLAIIAVAISAGISVVAWVESRTLDGYVAEVQEPERYLNQGSKVMVAPNSRPAMHYWSESDHQFHTVTR